MSSHVAEHSAAPPEVLAEAIDALRCVSSGDRVFVGSGLAVPQLLVDALSARGAELENVQIAHLMTMGPAPYAEPGMEKSFRANALFTGANVRTAVNEGRGDYTPVFLSEIPGLIRSGALKVDTCLLQVTPPGTHGHCSLGIDCACTLEAARNAKNVIGLVNDQMPWVYGENFLHKSMFRALIHYDHPLPELPRNTPSDQEKLIGLFCAELVPNGACLQLGIGAIPDAVLASLGDKRDLGMHTEMFSDGAVELVQKGVINCRAKTLHKDKMVASFVLGSKMLYDFVRSNPLVEFRPVDHTNDPFIIARNDNMISINSALQVDLTGQVCADSIGHTIFSGFGGQVDFVRGAARSKGGKPIIALESTAKSGSISRIVPSLSPGAGVVTSRADVHYIVTEFGVAYLHGKTLRERAQALIRVAHPQFRDELKYAAQQRNLI
ncbi:MAG: acetyl-CoA hydrolase/transferase family protein [bacterium]|nr:acetyl-CoA hydrolase/transferase family protein [bacterium]MBK8127662.1 acetyl-CoA hydrolase/transferase family protein [bacterium]